RRSGLRIRLGGGFWESRLKLALLGGALLIILVGLSIFTYYWVIYGRMIDQRLSGNVFEHTTGLYTAPGHIFAGQSMTSEELAAYLLVSAYRDTTDTAGIGRYTIQGSTMEIHPGKTSYFNGGNALRVDFSGKEIRSIRSIATAE